VAARGLAVLGKVVLAGGPLRVPDDAAPPVMPPLMFPPPVDCARTSGMGATSSSANADERQVLGSMSMIDRLL
jgi:hypothetical protein